MTDPCRVLMVGRHRLFRECLAASLETRERVRVVAQVGELAEAERWMEGEGAAEIVLVDLSRPEDVPMDRLARLARNRNGSRVVVLGLAEEEHDFMRCVEAGASGYVLQSSSLDDLEEALERVMAGEVFCSPRVTYSMFSRLGELAREKRRRERVEALELTPREMEVLGLIADGLSNREIAERIHLSIYTVKNHVHNILDKLDVAGRDEAVRLAYEHRWLEPPRRSVG